MPRRSEMSEAVSEIGVVPEQSPAQQVAAPGAMARFQAYRRRSRAQAKARRMFVVENQTARSIEIAPQETAGAAADVLLLPPFGARTLTAERFPQYDLAHWKNLGLVTTYVQKDNGATRLLYLGAAVFLVALLLTAVNLTRDNLAAPLASPVTLPQKIYTAFYHVVPLAGPFAW